MSIFNDICSDKLDEKISKCVLHFQAIVDQGMADNSRNRTTVPHLVIQCRKPPHFNAGI